MDIVTKQVRKAHRRLVLQQWLERVVYCLMATLAVAILAIVVPKFWYLGELPRFWAWAWMGGSLVVGLLAASIWTYFSRTDVLTAAIEIDLRFQLRERLSSSLSLDAKSLESPLGQALLADAGRQAERINVAERFPVGTGRLAALPLVIGGIAIMVAMMVPDVALDPVKTATAATTTSLTEEQNKVIKKTTEELRKQLEQKQKQAEEKGLKDASDLLKKLEQGTSQLAKKEEKVDQKDTLLKLNDLTKELKERRDSLGESDQLKKTLQDLKGMGEGPTSELAKAMKAGDIEKAAEAVKDLMEKLKNNELSEEEVKQLAEQMEQMGKKLQELAEKHEQLKEELQKQIEQAMAGGNKEEAERLKEQLEQLGMQDEQMGRMKEMGECLCKSGEKAGQGDGQAAAEELAGLQEDLDNLRQELDDLAMMDEALDQMEQARDELCKACQGGQMGNSFDQMMQGRGIGGLEPGTGRGPGLGPEDLESVSAYDSQVRGETTAGGGRIVDYIPGQNKPGEARLEIKEAMEAEATVDASVLTEQRLSRDQQKNAQQYFDLLREGK